MLLVSNEKLSGIFDWDTISILTQNENNNIRLKRLEIWMTWQLRWAFAFLYHYHSHENWSFPLFRLSKLDSLFSSYHQIVLPQHHFVSLPKPRKILWKTKNIHTIFSYWKCIKLKRKNTIWPQNVNFMPKLCLNESSTGENELTTNKIEAKTVKLNLKLIFHSIEEGKKLYLANYSYSYLFSLLYLTNGKRDQI